MGFVVRGYGRASTERQSMSTEQQEAVCLDVFALKKRIHPDWSDAVWGGFFADEATSRSTNFRERNAGSLVLAATRPGDRIASAVQDRMFGDLSDYCETIKIARQMGFRFIFGDQEIDPNDPQIVCVTQVMTAFAELERHKIRRRTKDSIAHRRRIGRPHAGGYPVGWSGVLCRVPGIVEPQKFFVKDNAARRLAREILIVKQSRHLTFEDARQLCNAMGLQQRNGRKWHLRIFRKWCLAALNDFPLANGEHEAAPIPANAVPVIVSTISEGD